MKTIYFPACIVIALISGTFAGAQDAKAPEQPVAKTPAPPKNDKKPPQLSMTEIAGIRKTAEAMQLHMKMGNLAASKGGSDIAFVSFGKTIFDETLALWEPMQQIAQSHQVDGKKIPIQITEKDKAEMDTLGKVKEEHWKRDYFKMFVKQSKRNAHLVDLAAKSFVDPELKEWGVKIAKLFAEQEDRIQKENDNLKTATPDASQPKAPKPKAPQPNPKVIKL